MIIKNNQNKDNILFSKTEGVDFIDISLFSKHELGILLNTEHKYNFDTVIGTTNSIKSFINYACYKCDRDVLLGGKLNAVNKLKLTNYWGMVAYVLCEKVHQNEKLMGLLLENKLPIYLLNYTNSNSIIDDNKVYKLNKGMKEYVFIINKIQALLKKNKFNKENILKLVRSFSNTDNIFEGSNIEYQLVIPLEKK